MKRISRKLTLFVGCMDRFINRLLFIFLLVMATIAFAQVCTRYILNFSIVWSEELCRYLFIWTIFLAIPSLLFRAALTSFDVLSFISYGGTAIIIYSAAIEKIGRAHV